MSGTSKISHRIGFRLPDLEYNEMDRLIKTSPKNPNESVDLFCKDIVMRYIWRHSTRKYRRKE